MRNPGSRRWPVRTPRNPSARAVELFGLGPPEQDPEKHNHTVVQSYPPNSGGTGKPWSGASGKWCGKLWVSLTHNVARVDLHPSSGRCGRSPWSLLVFREAWKLWTSGSPGPRAPKRESYDAIQGSTTAWLGQRSLCRGNGKKGAGLFFFATTITDLPTCCTTIVERAKRKSRSEKPKESVLCS